MTPLLDSFVFGAANSLHCACMCGPLAAALGGSGSSLGAYHGGRTIAYALLGGLLGGTGTWFGSDRLGCPTAIVAFVLAAGLLVTVFAGDRGAVRVPLLGQWLRRALAAGRTLPPVTRAALTGLLTPLLPCGLLWSACAGAAVTGSCWSGAVTMTGFAAGAWPALALLQHRGPLLARRFAPRTLRLLQRLAMLAAACLLLWRGYAGWHGDRCH